MCMKTLATGQYYSPWRSGLPLWKRQAAVRAGVFFLPQDNGVVVDAILTYSYYEPVVASIV